MEIVKNFNDLCAYIFNRQINVVIVEGVRGAGKSTLAQKLSKEFLYKENKEKEIPVYTPWKSRKNASIELIESQLDINVTHFAALDFFAQTFAPNKKEYSCPSLIIDRGYVTSIVFQGGTFGRKRFYRKLLDSLNSVIVFVKDNKPIEEYSYELLEEYNEYMDALFNYKSSVYENESSMFADITVLYERE